MRAIYSRSLTDGARSTEWRFNNKAEVLGEWVRVDLGGDRGVTRARIVPGKTYDAWPLFYLKGYRIEVSAEDTPDGWVLVPQRSGNTHLAARDARSRCRTGAAA